MASTTHVRDVSAGMLQCVWIYRAAGDVAFVEVASGASNGGCWMAHLFAGWCLWGHLYWNWDGQHVDTEERLNDAWQVPLVLERRSGLVVRAEKSWEMRSCPPE